MSDAPRWKAGEASLTKIRHKARTFFDTFGSTERALLSASAFVCGALAAHHTGGLLQAGHPLASLGLASVGALIQAVSLPIGLVGALNSFRERKDPDAPSAKRRWKP